ncbi:cupin domain-containing protein [Streptomyces luomodiensis]|uniref:Cupin domain-containing protein n=1 Tax=Streptomyces luomodiensis TaxID=3026192 RepID=A0ABY9V6U5_9ACTN|nr:cupin domain-containing protein [Streptomyces sp. SCA4-21]WNF00367.1 cupin domain-containing protein [Streptomyces sp. SCA4-21]
MRAEETFTGEAWRDPLVPLGDGVSIGNVFFSPCARTYWHEHDGGQLLFVLAGSGLVCTADETIAVGAGDRVWTPPGVRHWHGATGERFMFHTAITVGGTTWQEEVSEETYSVGCGRRDAR